MPVIHGQNKTPQETKLYLEKHFSQLKARKNGRTQTTMSLVPSNYKVLDYGCGWGFYSNAMAESGNVVEGIDYKNEIEICQLYWGEIENVTFSTKPIVEINDKTFDAVLSCQVIEHVHNPGNYISQINRVLRDQGKFIVSLPNIINPRFIFPHFNPKYPERLKELSLSMMHNYDKVNHHINSWDPRHFVILLASLGFELEVYKTSEGIPLPTVFPFTKLYGGYINNFISRMKLFNNFCYTMHFSFIKRKEVIIKNYD